MGRFTQKDPFWNVGNMVYGSRPRRIGNTLVPDSLAIIQSSNLYAYAVNSPIMYADSSGLAATFVQARLSGQWYFFSDNKYQSVILSTTDIFIPFYSDAVYGLSDLATGSKTVTRHIFDDTISKLGSSLGAYSSLAPLITNGAKFTDIAFGVSLAISIPNAAKEWFSNVSYINQITGQMYALSHRSSSFDEAYSRFFLYSVLVKNLVDYGAITYKTSWGDVTSYEIDRDKYDQYFKDLGVTSQEYDAWIKEMAKSR